ncbi:MBL fold metallo-hydrolase, partial [Akkermansiaceae bacterium]|nr:MBL fold metallo-hydrolase [Akkermansiaceae bacterium]
MTLHTYTGGAVQTNGYILEFDDKTCFVVDAPAGMADFLAGHGLKATHLLLTHQHFDHVEDASALAQAGAKIHAHSEFDRTLIRDKQA